MVKRKDRCWEFMRCAMEMECAAYPDKGEECWLNAGSMRQASTAEERLDRLKREAIAAGRELTEQELRLYKPVGNKKMCKYLERYAMCQCCPYYQFMERKKKEQKRGRFEF